MTKKTLANMGLAACVLLLPGALAAKEKMTSDFKFKSGMIRIMGNTGELGVADAGPFYFAGTQVVEHGILEEAARVNGIEVQAGREIWFHKNGKVRMIKGTGKKQKIDGVETDGAEHIEFDDSGRRLLKKVKVLPAKINSESMKPLVNEAIAELKLKLPAIAHKDFMVLRVYILDNIIRFAFEFPFKLSDPYMMTEVGVNYVDGMTDVYPGANQKFASLNDSMRKILEMFPPQKERLLYFYDRDDHFEVRSVAISRNGFGGGSEAYRVDKKTFQKAMLWHEHPQRPPIQKDEGLVDKKGNAVVEKDWEEVYFEVLKP